MTPTRPDPPKDLIRKKQQADAKAASADKATADFHATVLRLVEEGNSLQQVADWIGRSKPRVQQIVSSARRRALVHQQDAPRDAETSGEPTPSGGPDEAQKS